MLPGRGVRAMVAGRRVAAGNAQLLAEEGVALPRAGRGERPRTQRQGCSLIYLAVDGAYAGFIALSDTLRPDARDTVRRVREGRR